LAISDQTIARINELTEIEEVVSDYVTLKRKGQNLWANCPFHEEKTPSFSVAPSKGIYKCFGCGKAGDAISFIREYEGLGYIEAIKLLANKYGVEIEEDQKASPEEIQEKNQKESLLIALKYAGGYFQKLLWESEEGQAIGYSYFRERGFNDKIVKKFELGYALDRWDGLLKEAVANGYNPDILEKSGLIIRKEEKEYDRFRGRVIFPVHNLSGRVIAFGARILKKDNKQPKYINSPETEVYEKSKVLYGLHLAKQSIRQNNNCYLVEGYTDVISLHLSGVENVVASSGTSLTVEHIKQISRFTENLTVLFDGDEAGIKASLRGIDMILEQGLNVRACVFPDGEDPDSYARKLGRSDFQQYLDTHTVDFIRFKTDLFTRNAKDDPIKKAESIREIISSISYISDPIKRAIYLRECSNQLQMDENTLYAQLNSIIRERSKKPKERGNYREEQVAEPELAEMLEESKLSEYQIISLQEKESIRLLLNYSLNVIEEEYKLYEFMLNELEDLEFQTPIFAQILTIFKEKLEQDQVINAEYLIKNGSEEIKATVIDLVSEKYVISINWNEKFEIYVPHEQEILKSVAFSNVFRLKFRVIKKLIKENMDKLKLATVPSEQEKLMLIHQELKRSEMEAARVLGNVIAY